MFFFVFFKQKTAYEMRISDWSSDVCSSDLQRIGNYKALAAYRMHATVVAMALDVPVIGFEWDTKVLQLFTYCGKQQACVSLAEFMQHPALDIITALLRKTHAQPATVSQPPDRYFPTPTYL